LSQTTDCITAINTLLKDASGRIFGVKRHMPAAKR
jgi:hypothetical protein